MTALFALAGLIILAIGMLVAGVRHMRLGGGAALGRVAAVAFVAALVMHASVEHRQLRRDDLELLATLAAICAGIGWLCALAAIGGVTRQEA